MVSIPDWARFAQVTDSKKKDSKALMNKFYKQKEAEAVRQAEKSGYFLTPTLDVIVERCGPLNPTIKDADAMRLMGDAVRLVRLMGVHLRQLGDIGACSRITVCLLANNFITKIDSLLACRHLLKLDLHSNQLSVLPASVFWSSLRRLACLHLHDNPLGRLDSLQTLGSAPALTVLTLYDTPLSLKKNYRHHVVNSLWSLKALDHHVISDEEIIEDAIFTTHFKALSNPLRVELCPPSPEGGTINQELIIHRQTMARINSVLARHSPVLIVQRCLRGFLLRRKMGIKTSPFKWANPPPGTPVNDRTASMDYDSYLREMRPGSILSVDQDRPRLHVSLQKLDQGTLSGLHRDSVAIETVMAENDGTHIQRKPRKKSGKQEEEKPRRIKDIRHFFGQMVPSIDPEEAWEVDEELPEVDYRLRGRKPKLLVSDATTEMILSRKEAGQMVRDAEGERIKMVAEEEVPKAVPHGLPTTEQRFFSRAQGTMGMSCLLAVHKAYREREKAERSATKMENILGMREERQRAKDRINAYHDERRVQVLKNRDMDRARMVDKLEKRELNRLNFLDKHQEGKVRASDGSKALRAEHSFVLEFNSQHTSVSNALLRHDRQARASDQRGQRENKVSAAKVTEVEQQETVRKYLEHRQVMKQTETSMAKAALDTKMLSEANDRMMEARTRVSQLKSRKDRIQAFYPVQPSTIPPASTAPAGMSRWEAQSAVTGGRVGRHNTIYT